MASKTENIGYLANIYRKGLLAPGLEPVYLPVSSGQWAKISHGAPLPYPTPLVTKLGRWRDFLTLSDLCRDTLGITVTVNRN